ncbi:MAG: 50S ribosomal protein L6 [Planctomycetes bacterium]|nr:50S ribosomal protein L6 [Planctomycetota bacterium]
MSRIGKQPVAIPAGVKISVAANTVNVEGPKGKLSLALRPEITVKVDGSAVVVDRKNDSKQARALHGTVRAHLANMVQGVTQGYQKILDIVGVGWGGKVQGKVLQLQVGFCHSVDLPIPEGVTCTLPNPQRLEVKGIDIQKVGQFAAQIRAAKKPEPYKGKGIRYDGEQIIRKAGKSFVGGAGGK